MCCDGYRCVVMVMDALWLRMFCDGYGCVVAALNVLLSVRMANCAMKRNFSLKIVGKL